MKALRNLAILRSGALTLGLYLTLTILALAAGPMEDVKGLMDQVIALIQDPAFQSPGQKAARLQLIEKITAHRLDYQEMGKRCLGDTWDTLSKSQRSEFANLFSQLLKISYADRLDELAKAKVVYEKETRKGDQAEVSVVIVRPNDKIPVTFHLQQAPQGWKIYDLGVDGVSLMSNLKSQFSRVIQTSSYGNLVECLKVQLRARKVDVEACPPPSDTKKPKPQKAEC